MLAPDPQDARRGGGGTQPGWCTEVPCPGSTWRTLMDIREFLYLLDWRAGHAWVETLLSDDTGVAVRGS
ncbi:MAG: hypothetical protein M3O31_08200 [Acidobacteriota bacterium]|nr:hypothetical protein [Acidobacteriota bacterium]